MKQEYIVLLLFLYALPRQAICIEYSQIVPQIIHAYHRTGQAQAYNFLHYFEKKHHRHKTATTDLRLAILDKNHANVVELIKQGHPITMQNAQLAHKLYNLEKKQHQFTQRLLYQMQKLCNISTQAEQNFKLICNILEQQDINAQAIFTTRGGFDKPEDQLVDAAVAGNTDIVKNLLAQGVNPNAVSNSLGALEAAVFNGNIDTVKALLDGHARVTRLHEARVEGKMTILSTCMHDQDPWPETVVSATPVINFGHACKKYIAIKKMLHEQLLKQEAEALEQKPIHATLMQTSQQEQKTFEAATQSINTTKTQIALGKRKKTT